jgi:CHAT domain-containing protein
VLEKLTPNSVLLIAPHRQLNHFPWSALSAGGEPLVGRSIPVVVPSLQSLAALMARPKSKTRFDKGLLLAVSAFNGRHEPLPFTVEETKSLLRLYPKSDTLLGEETTWSALLGLAEASGLSSYAFLHVASHAFADGVSGRLSGLAMFDRDVWVDELWDCAPFPALVTLSACSGSKSRLYDGDEQVGLAATFLAAGARHVVASLWPVKDEEAAGLMKTFYSYLLLGNSVSLALALAQRAAAQNGKAVSHWAGFRCTGLPV